MMAVIAVSSGVLFVESVALRMRWSTQGVGEAGGAWGVRACAGKG